MKRLIALVVFALLTSTSYGSAQGYTPVLSERECKTYIPQGDIENETIFCGTMTVPQDRSQPDGQQIGIAYAILRSRSANFAPDPILFLSGGPGNSAMHPAAFVELIARFEVLRANRDIIMFDQRGVGASGPSFLCSPSQADDQTLQNEFEARIGRELTEEDQDVVRCVKGFEEQGIDLNQFNTVENARDTMDLMQSLGYEQYNLYGISYGTRLEMSIMHHFPNSPLIRSLVLDSIFPLPEPPYNEFVADNYTQNSSLFEHVFELCSNDTACNQAYPDLRSRFDALLEKVTHQPIQLPDGSTLDRDGLLREVFPYNQAINYIPYQPRLITELERSETATIQFLRSGAIQPQPRPNAFRTNDHIEAVYDGFLNCIADVQDINPIIEQLRQLYDAEIPRIIELIQATCTLEQANQLVPIIQNNFQVGDFNRVIRSLYTAPYSGSSNNLRQNITCREEWSYSEPRAVFENSLHSANLPQFMIEEALGSHQQGARICPIWGNAPATPTPESFGQYPTLLLNGEFDFVTYAPWAQQAAQRLEDSIYVPLPNTMHSILNNYGACPTQITQAFLDDPLSAPDISCTSDMQVKFILPDAPLQAAL